MKSVNKKKLIIFTVITFFVGYYILSFFLWTNNFKKPVPKETMKSVVEQQGYEWNEKDILEEFIIASAIITIENDITVEYLEFNSGENARTYFLEEKEPLLRNKDGDAVFTKDMDRWGEISTMGGEEYVLIIRIDNTLLKSKCEKTDKELLKQFYAKVGYK